MRRRLLFTGAGVVGVALLHTVTACDAAAEPPEPTPSAAGWQRVSLSFVSAYVLVRGREAAIVDLGTAGSADAIGSTLTAAGSGWDQVKHIVLTHHHGDHAGGLTEVAPKVNASVYAGEADVARITGGPAPKPVRDGDDVFGLRIVATPGHTPGHVSVFDPATGTLVAGDALRTTEGLVGADPRYTADPAQAAASVRKLAGLDVRTILPGHGDPLTTGAAEALRTLAAAS